MILHDSFIDFFYIRSNNELLAQSRTIGILQSKIGDLEAESTTEVEVDRTNTIGSFTSPRQTSSRQHKRGVEGVEAFTQTKTSRASDSSYDHHQQDEDSSLIAMHIREMRELKKQLEETRLNNDALRRQLEERLAQVERDARMLNEPNMEVNLIRDNDRMRQRVAELSEQKREMDERIGELVKDKQTWVIRIKYYQKFFRYDICFQLNQMSLVWF